MDISLFLAKIFGPYLIAVGAAAILKRKELSVRISSIFDNPILVYAMSALELIIGILLLLLHSVWVWGWPVIITIWAWLMIIESAVFLFLPSRLTKKMVRMFVKKGWYITFSIISILLGVYLAVIGFALV